MWMVCLCDFEKLSYVFVLLIIAIIYHIILYFILFYCFNFDVL